MHKKLIVVLAALALAACGGPLVDKTRRVPGVLALTGDETAGAAVYSSTCSSCHGPDGKGKSGPGIAAAVPSLSAEELATIALNGTGLMGPAGAKLEDQQIADLVSWLKATVR